MKYIKKNKIIIESFINAHIIEKMKKIGKKLIKNFFVIFIMKVTIIFH